MSDMSSSLLATTGDRTIDKLQRLPFLDLSPGGTSPEGNISLRRGGDIDHHLPPPLLGHHLQTLGRESLKAPNICTRKEKEDQISSDSSPSFSPSDNQFHDYGRCKRSRHCLQAVETPIMLQPAEITNISTIPQPEHVIQSSAKDSSSESEM